QRVSPARPSTGAGGHGAGLASPAGPVTPVPALLGAQFPLQAGQIVLHVAVPRRWDVLDLVPLRRRHYLAGGPFGDAGFALRLLLPDLGSAFPGEAVLTVRLDRNGNDRADDQGDDGPLQQAEHRFEDDESDQGTDGDQDDLGPAHQPPPFRG